MKYPHANLTLLRLTCLPDCLSLVFHPRVYRCITIPAGHTSLTLFLCCKMYINNRTHPVGILAINILLIPVILSMSVIIMICYVDKDVVTDFFCMLILFIMIQGKEAWYLSISSMIFCYWNLGEWKIILILR